MGFYISVIGDSNLSKKKKEFEKKLSALLHYGGMASIEKVDLYGKKLLLINPVERKDDIEDKIDVWYNVFERENRDNLVYDSEEGYLTSNNIGEKQFYIVSYAAYILEEMYSSEKHYCYIENGSSPFVQVLGWLKYLFHKEWNLTNRFDVLDVFLKLYEEWGAEPDMEDIESILDMVNIYEADFIGCLALDYYLSGYKKTYEKYVKCQEVYETDNPSFFVRSAELVLNKMQQCEDVARGMMMDYDDEPWDTLCYLNRVIKNQDKLAGFDSDEKLFPPALMAACIGRGLHIELSTFLSQIKDVDWRGAWSECSKNYVYPEKMFTEDVLGVDKDEMIYYFEDPDEMQHFSGELKECMKKWQSLFEQKKTEQMEIKSCEMLKRMINIFSEAQASLQEYLVYKNMFYEFLDHSEEAEYKAAWLMVEEIIKNAIEKNAQIWRDFLRRMQEEDDLICLDSFETKNNIYIKEVRWLLALLANKSLRKAVFGF